MHARVPEITSRRHPLVEHFVHAARRESGLAVLDGWHLLHDAVRAGLEIVSVAVGKAPADDDDRRLLARIDRESVVRTVSAAVLDRLSPSHTPSGVVALVRPRPWTFADLLSTPPALVVTAIDAQDPANAGAIIRSAEAGGATGVLLAGASADPWGWKALRSAMGSTFRTPVVRCQETEAALDRLRQARLALVAAVPRGGVAMQEVDLRRPSALVFGSEGRGLDPGTLAVLDTRVSVPMSGAVESLNLAVAAALLTYEARRQRTT